MRFSQRSMPPIYCPHAHTGELFLGPSALHVLRAKIPILQGFSNKLCEIKHNFSVFLLPLYEFQTHTHYKLK